MATPEKTNQPDQHASDSDRTSLDLRKSIKDLSPQPRETEHVKGGIPKQGSPFPIVVGDYLVSASASALESPTVSNSQTTSIQVQRVGSTSAAPLEIWLAVTGHVLPVASELVFSTTFAATASAGADPADATYQGWYSTTNSSFIPGPPTAPPADGITAGPIGCVVGGANVRRPGSMACSAFPPASVDVAAGVPFSLVTRTTFNILTPSAATYGSTAQANVKVAP